jgi:hypothetical protein
MDTALTGHASYSQRCHCGGRRATTLPLVAFHMLGGFHHQQ